MELVQASPAATRPAATQAQPRIASVRAGGPATPVIQRRCGGDCGCHSCKGALEDGREDTLARSLRAAVEGRELQRMPQLQAPAGLLQRACTRTRLSQLQSQMHSWCDSGISCRRAYDCDDVNDRMQAGYECYDLREQIQSECYDNQTDRGHAEQLQAVSNAIDGCERKWNSWRC